LTLVAPQPAATAPVEATAATVVVQAPAAPQALVFDGKAITVQGTGGVAEVLPNRTERGVVPGNERYIYVGFSSAAIGSENEAAAEWKIYRYDTVTDTSSFASGVQTFTFVWDDRESLTYP
jgi:hypothetical protein